jgi:hypothetical protein
VADNVIPKNCKAIISVTNSTKLEKKCREFQKKLCQKFDAPDITIDIEKKDDTSIESIQKHDIQTIIETILPINS